MDDVKIIENKEKIDNEAERIKKLSKMVLNFMESQNMSMEQALEYIFKNREDREKVKDRIEINLAIKEMNERIIEEGGKRAYWIMNKSTTKTEIGDYAIRGWHKMKVKFDEFFESLGFRDNWSKEIFYNEKDALELVLLPISEVKRDDEDEREYDERVVCANYDRLREYKNAVKKIKTGKKECSYFFIMELCDYLFRIARKKVLGNTNVKTLIQNHGLDFYCVNIWKKDEQKQRMQDFLVKLALVVDHKMDENKMKNDMTRHCNGRRMIRFLMNVYEQYPEEIEYFQEDFLYAQDLFMEQMLDSWCEEWKKIKEKKGR